MQLYSFISCGANSFLLENQNINREEDGLCSDFQDVMQVESKLQWVIFNEPKK